ncbi:MAG TPA: hypothetical protein VHX20_00275 [Terracidiphilus sp.]|jgi:hypothetical protein|nr:hypothetical protein [Terracidiphilus sp.]
MGLFTGLFKGKKADEADVDLLSACSAQDSEEFINYLRGKDRQFSQPGRSIREEFKVWLAYNTKRQAHATSYNANREFATAMRK